MKRKTTTTMTGETLRITGGVESELSKFCFPENLESGLQKLSFLGITGKLPIPVQ